jgi:hypothetical protein
MNAHMLRAKVFLQGVDEKCGQRGALVLGNVLCHKQDAV